METASRSVTVLNAQGLHARPADMLVRVAKRFDSTIEIVKDQDQVDGKSILSVLTLAAVQGTRLALKATGADAAEAVDALAQLFESGFAEDADQLSVDAERTRSADEN